MLVRLESTSFRPPDFARAPRAGDTVEVEIERLDRKGRGVGTLHGRAVALRHALPGSRVRAVLGRRRKGRFEGRVVGVPRPSHDARPARCPHSGTCGGCAFQELEYAAQLVELRLRIERTLAAAGLAHPPAVEPVIGAADPWHYRNKMDFTFGDRRWLEPGEGAGLERDFALGLHVPGRFDKVLDVRSCAIAFPEAGALLHSARHVALELGLAPWSTLRRAGCLRHLVLRKGFRTGEILVHLVTAGGAAASADRFAEALLARHPEVTTFVHGENTRPAAIAVAERERVLKGEGRIRERVGDLELELSAGSFFQTNTAQAERLFEIVAEEAGCTGSERVADLYCGTGSIGLWLARAAESVVGCEEVPDAVADAERNARRNGIPNARFLAGDVRRLLEEGTLAGPVDVCVLDPPRAGLHPKVLPALRALAARRLVYVSCNVRAAAADLARLSRDGWRLERVRPIDLFPHTPHVECVFTLSRGAAATRAGRDLEVEA